MGVARDFKYYTYKTDAGDLYSVRKGKEIGDIAELGFGAMDATKPVLPRGWKMRYAMVLDPLTGNRRKIHVGDPASDVWDGTDSTISLPVIGSAAPVNYEVTLLVGERAHKAHTVYNL